MIRKKKCKSNSLDQI